MSSIIKIPTVINKVSALVNKVAVIIFSLLSHSPEPQHGRHLAPGQHQQRRELAPPRPVLPSQRDPHQHHRVPQRDGDLVPPYSSLSDPSKGTLTSCSAYGVLRVDSRLSQSPEVALTLQNPGAIEALRVHRCVDRARLRSSQTLQFVPLDGVFDVPIPAGMTRRWRRTR